MKTARIISSCILLLAGSISIHAGANSTDFNYSTSKIEGDTVVITSQYFQKHLFTDVYRIEEAGGFITVITRTHGVKKFLKPNIICIDFTAHGSE
jgi:hypothetical protein